MSIDSVQSGVMTDLKQEQITTLYRNTILSFWGNLILASIISLFFARYNQNYTGGNPTYCLLIWFTLLVTACFYRRCITQAFNPEYFHDTDAIILWANKYILLTTVINTIWGTAGFILILEDLPHQILLSITLFSVLLISTPVLAISRFAFSIQIIAVLTPLFVSLVINQSYQENAYLLPISILIFATTLYGISNYIHQTLMELRDSQSSLRKQANTDTLTQISNRRFFDLTFKNEWRRSIRDNAPISILLIDIDHFSHFNDTQGQCAGDNCLKTIAACMDVVTRRPADLAARYSGEEFIILLPNTTMDNAAMLGERLRAKVASLEIDSPSAKHGIITISVGVSCYSPVTDKNSNDDEAEVMYPAMLMNAADNAMFLAKKQGRNRVATQKCGEQRIAQVLQKYAEKDASRT